MNKHSNGTESNNEVATLKARVVELEAAQHSHEDTSKELRSYRERRGTLADAVHNVIINVDPAGAILFVNRATFDGTPDELIGTSVYDLFPAQYHGVARECIESVLKTGTPGSFEMFGAWQDGFPRWWKQDVSVIKNTHGDAVALNMIAVDITDRRESEQTAKRNAEERHALAEIGRIISSSADIDEICDRFAKRVRSLIPSDRVSIGLIDWQAETVNHAYVWGVDVPGRGPKDFVPLQGSYASLVAEKRSGVLLQTKDRDEIETTSPSLLAIFDVGIRSFITVPLIFKDLVIGVLHLRSRKVNAYSPADLALAEDVGTQICAAIANAQLHAAQQREAVERKALAEIGRIISSSLDIDKVYERFAEQVRTLISFDRIAITLVDAKDSKFTTAYSTGIQLPDRSPGHVADLAGTITEHVFHAKRGHFLDLRDNSQILQKYPGMRPSLDAGIKSVLSAPLIFNDEVIGVLFLESTKAEAYAPRDLELAERVGAQIAGAISNAQLYAEILRAEQALEESVERFDLAVRGSSEGLWDWKLPAEPVTYLPDETVYYSPLYKEMLGYTDEEYPSKNATWAEHLHPEDRERVLKAFRDHLEKRIPFDVEHRMLTASGEYRWFSSRGQAVWDENGKPVRVAGSMRDMTERKRLESQLFQAQKMEALGTLTGGIAHDFNNLLTAILGYAQLGLMTIPRGDRLYSNFKEIEKAAERATGLTRQLLTFSRSQSSAPRILSLNDLVLDMDNMLRRLIGEDVEMVNLPSKDAGLVRMDPGQMEQVLINLVVNARDAMPDGGKIFIETAEVVKPGDGPTDSTLPDGEYVMLAVRDTGPGIPDEIKNRVFEPFFTTKEPGKGTGLGLSMCYGVTTQVGGHITVDSEVGKGSEFKLYFPKVKDAPGRMSIRDESGYLPVGDETILLVEDESLVRQISSRVLRDQGYTVIEAENGVEALRMAKEHSDQQIDLVLTDVVMPLMGGRELAQKIREFDPQVKVLYTSGYADQRIGHHGISQEGLAFMQKPFTPSVLARKVREILDSS